MLKYNILINKIIISQIAWRGNEVTGLEPHLSLMNCYSNTIATHPFPTNIIIVVKWCYNCRDNRVITSTYSFQDTKAAINWGPWICHNPAQKPISVIISATWSIKRVHYATIHPRYRNGEWIRSRTFDKHRVSVYFSISIWVNLAHNILISVSWHGIVDLNHLQQ